MATFKVYYTSNTRATHPVQWNKATQNFVAEHSEVSMKSNLPGTNIPVSTLPRLFFKLPSAGTTLELIDVDTHKVILFQYEGTDYNGTEHNRDSIAGWQFKAIQGMQKPCGFLLIND